MDNRISYIDLAAQRRPLRKEINAALAGRARSLREHRSTTRYYHDEIGFSYPMEGFQGAVLRVNLRHLADWAAERECLSLPIYPKLTEPQQQRVADVIHLFFKK